MNAKPKLSRRRLVSGLIVAAVICGVLAGGTYGVGTAHPAPRASDGVALHPTPFVFRTSTAVPVGKNPVGVAYDSGKGEVFVTNTGSGNVSVISDATDAVVATISVGTKPYAAAYDSAKGEVFIANEQGGSVSVINDTDNTVVATVDTGDYPTGLAYDSGKGEVFVAGDQTSVFVISDATNSVVATVGVGNVTEGLTYDAAHGQVFASMFDDQDVWVISDATNTVTSIVHVGTTPVGLATDSAKGLVFSANYGSANVSALSTVSHSVVANVRVGSGPSSVAYDQGQAYLLVANSVSANVSVVSDATDKVISTFPVGSAPFGIAFDDAKGVAFVSNYGSNNVSVVAPASGGGGPTHYTVTCTESGLPAGTSWSVTLNGTTMSSTTATITFSEPSGTYAYTVGAVAGYFANPQTGSADVNGAAVNLPISFTPSSSGPYAVTFTESGLASGTSWTVTLNSVPMSSTNTMVVFSEPNGSYSYTVTSTSADTPTPSSGSVTVSGAPIGQAVTFIAPGGATYDVTFTETGLPVGSSWQVKLNGQTQSTTTTGTTFSVPNGTYPFDTLALIDYAPVPANGTVVVAGQAVTTPIVYYEVFPLKFTEPGLPTGANWSVTLSRASPGVILTASLADPSLTLWSDGASSVLFSVSNGTFSYTSSAPGYTGNASTVTVNGASPPPVSLTFTANPSPAASSAAGLPILDWVLIGVVIIVVAIAAAMLLMRRKRKAPPSPTTHASEPGEGAPPAPP
ncbi:MAG: YncE family protein [Thermoplasmata archaeon]|jgi:YVTN family beta-propeller protein